VALDGSRRHEEQLRDLAVRQPLAGELGDPQLARSKRVDAGEDDAARPRPGRAQLGLRPRREQSSARAMSGVERLAEKPARLAPPVPPPKERAEIGQRSRPLELRARALE
jgi:hypothetical protein